MTTHADWAMAYTDRLRLALTPILRGRKHPTHRRWNAPENIIATKEKAQAYWSWYPTDGMACVLEYSEIVTLDIDNPERAEFLLPHFGVDPLKLKVTCPTIIGRNYKIVFRKPDHSIRHRSYAEPVSGNALRSAVVFELRCGRISDNLPPTVHPKTGKPYFWENPPRNGFPPVPQALLHIWLNWDDFRRDALKMCPWAPAPKERPASKRSPASQVNTRPSVIRAFNEAHTAAAILESHGYERRDKRFTPPGASHDAGIVQLDNGKIFCHHAGDLLHSEHALDSFDLYRLLEHGGEYRAAVKAAAETLGLSLGRA